jgi:23S rRNA pseudouridine1911/1915/1917 synthase
MINLEMVEIDILFENDNIICLNKMPGMPTQPDLTQDVSLYNLVQDYLKSEVYILNRLDRPVGGIVVFGKNKDTTHNYSTNIKDYNTSKIYFAIVENRPSLDKGTLTNYLIKRNKKAFVTKDRKIGKKAELEYKYIGSGKRYHFLEISLKTGRFHQIRVQLSNIGCTIKGDVKYGAKRSNKDRSICLYAKKMTFTDPFSKNDISLNAPLPKKVLWNEMLKYI